MFAFAVVAAQYVSTFDAMVSAREDARANNPPNLVNVGGTPGPNGTVVGGTPEKIAIATDFLLTGSVLLRTHDRYWDFTLGYAPSITVPDLELQVDSNVNPPVEPTLLHSGSAGIRWHDRFSWVSVNENGSYGKISTAIPYAGPPASATSQTMGMTPTGTGTTTTPPGTTTTPGTPPTGMTTTPTQTTLFRAQDVQYAASTSSLAFGTRIGRHTALAVSGGYSLSGGLDSDTTVVPYFEGPSGNVTVATTVSPTEAIFTNASGNYTFMKGTCPFDLLSPAAQSTLETQAITACQGAMDPKACAIGFLATPIACRTKSSVAQISEGYGRRLGLLSSVLASAGLGAVYGPGLNGTQELGVVPVFAVSYSQALYTYWPGLLNLTLSVAPAVDLLTSVVSDMATIAATLNAQVAKRVIVAFSLTGAQTIPIPADTGSDLTSVAASVEGRFRLNREVDLVLGDQEFWQNQMNASVPAVVGPSGVTFVPAAAASSSSTFVALLYLGVTLRSPTLHF